MEESDNPSNGVKPTTHQRDLAKLPKCLAPLIERQQWAVWRWTQKPGGWQKPPFISAQPDRHASTNDPSTWSSYATALATVQAGHADGITYMLKADDPFAAIDLDHCRDPDTHSIDIWAQLFLMRGRDTYQEVTPSGSGCRIWGLANGEKLHRKFDLVIDDKPIAAELFRQTNKALTVTGYQLDTIRELTSIDRVMDWAIVWGSGAKRLPHLHRLMVTASIAAATGAVTASIRLKRSCVPARQQEAIVATCSI